MKGLRTYFVAFLMAMVPSTVTYFASFDWVGFLTAAGVPQQWVVPAAGIAASLVMAGLRSVTTTPPGPQSK